MKERKEGIRETASFAAGLTGFAALLVGGCGGFTIWYGISGDYHAAIIPMFGIPISLVLGLTFYLLRKNYLKPQKETRKGGMTFYAVFFGIPVLGFLFKHLDIFFNHSTKLFIQVSGMMVAIFLPVTAFVILIVFLFVSTERIGREKNTSYKNKEKQE